MKALRRLALAFPALLLSAGAASSAEKDRVEYGRDVRPILAEKCFHCHGQDSRKRMAGLRLDTAEGATAMRSGRAAVVAGHPEQSGVFQRITAGQAEKRMPPVWSNRTLSEQQIATLRRWIEQGGEYAQHWAFLPPKRPPLPKTSNDGWVKQPIDAFVLRRLEEERMRQSPPAGPGAWLRRASLDLIGLPPSPPEVDAFTKEAATRGEAAYAQAVDRLLASPRYGERMAMDWLDVARYADTHGFNNDSSRSMWRWRDWVINAFNDNMRYDRFLTEQLAGDLLPNATLEQRLATGYGRNHVINSEGGIIDEEYRVEYVADRVRTLGMSWFGLTLECARCHDHKYDPLTQRDYYRLFAFFNSVPEYGEDGRVANAMPLMRAPTEPQSARMRELEAQIASLTPRLERREKAWTWKDRWAADLERMAAASGIPDGRSLQIGCDAKTPAAEGARVAAPGIAGAVCAPAQATPKAETEKIPISKRSPLTFTAWLRPTPKDTDVPLLSAVDYSSDKASTNYGKGMEFRLAGGELEFRFGDRFPVYTVHVRSEGAALNADQWHHVALVYEGGVGADTTRAEASWVRIFADGRELATRVISENVSIPDVKDDKPSQTKFRIGWDNRTGSLPFDGWLSDLSLWPRALKESEITAVFEHGALPWAAARRREGSASPTETAWLRSAQLRAAHADYDRDVRKVASLRSELLALRRNAPTVMVMEEMASPRETHLLLRGAYNAPGEKVEPGVPEALFGSWPVGAPRNRLGLAQWLTKPDHPLTARVVVNRFWQQMFGTGLVKTSDNFGLQGEFPSHPELLDWLAREFVESGWNVKALIRQIALSATYRQDSAAPQELYARDPENRLLARGPRFRLPAELIRDQALVVSGLLKHRMGGPSVYPYQPADLYKGIVVAANYPGTKYVESQGDDLYRRSLYTFWKRTVPHPTMTVFDAPDREFCVVRRSTTNTPLQALTLLNDPIFVEAARSLAARAFREGGASADERLSFMFRMAAGRLATDGEKQVLRKTYEKMLSAYRGDEAAARALVSVGASPVDSSLPAGEFAAYTAVANMILNMDEVITKG